MANDANKNYLRKVFAKSFFIRTYATKNQVEEIMQQYAEEIVYYRAIKHDKDQSEPHIHILIKFTSRKHGTTILNMFKDLIDEKGMPINTEIKKTITEQGALEYLTHNTKECEEQGKYKYSADEIWGKGIIEREKSEIEELKEAVLEIIAGEEPLKIMTAHGIKVLYNWKALKSFASDEYDYLSRKTTQEMQQASNNFFEGHTPEQITVQEQRQEEPATEAKNNE